MYFNGAIKQSNVDKCKQQSFVSDSFFIIIINISRCSISLASVLCKFSFSHFFFAFSSFACCLGKQFAQRVCLISFRSLNSHYVLPWPCRVCSFCSQSLSISHAWIEEIEDQSHAVLHAIYIHQHNNNNMMIESCFFHAISFSSHSNKICFISFNFILFPFSINSFYKDEESTEEKKIIGNHHHSHQHGPFHRYGRKGSFFK